MKRYLLLFFAFALTFTARAQETYLFTEQDGESLYLDILRPAEGSETTFQGKDKPAIMFLFGGGFITGSRTDKYFQTWFQILTSEGYTVIAIDYRLGMKDYKVGKGVAGAYKACKQFYIAQQMGVEDVCRAIRFLSDNREEIGIDPSNIVLSGSSAGAIISLATEYDIANGTAEGLPEGFNFRGVMSFAGAIISIIGAPEFKNAPCPLLLLHGTADKAVAYNHYGAFGRGLWGSAFISARLKKKGWNHTILRFAGRTHDVAGYMEAMWEKEKDFLEQDVILGKGRNIDEMIDDPSLPSWGDISLDQIYK